MAAEGQSDKMVSDMEVHMEQTVPVNSSTQKKKAPIDIAEHVQSPNSGYEHSEVVNGAFQ